LVVGRSVEEAVAEASAGDEVDCMALEFASGDFGATPSAEGLDDMLLSSL
jgi:hypothetical protein